MSQLTGWICFIVLTAIAAVHVYWGLGGLWPAETEPALVRTVIGAEAAHMPTDDLTFVVAALIFVAGCLAMMRGVFNWDSFLLLRLPLFGLALIFLARGAITYIPALFPPATEPFGTLNALYYSPLCLILAAAFGFLAVSEKR